MSLESQVRTQRFLHCSGQYEVVHYQPKIVQQFLTLNTISMWARQAPSNSCMFRANTELLAENRSAVCGHGSAQPGESIVSRKLLALCMHQRSTLVWNSNSLENFLSKWYIWIFLSHFKTHHTLYTSDWKTAAGCNPERYMVPRGQHFFFKLIFWHPEHMADSSGSITTNFSTLT